MGIGKMVGGCFRVTGAAAMIPIAVIIAVMLETPTVTKFDGTASLAAATPASQEGAPAHDATEATPGQPDGPRMGSGNMFDRIAVVYDVTNKWMSLRDDKVLDLATGTADVGLLVGERLKFLGDGSASADAVIGVDPSPEMLRRGVSKVESRGLTGVVRLVKGDAQDLSMVQGIDAAGSVSEPSPGAGDGSVDKISMSFGIRNVPDRTKALREMRRVLKNRPTSRVCILEFSLPSFEQGYLAGLARGFITHVVPFMGRIATMGEGSEEYEYLERSILRFPKPADFAAELGRAGLPVQTITSFAFGAVNLYAAAPAAA
eukprot:CAMPEP_0115164538 /NCGR_PEP_ID=MMETSP0227-20121206/73090_1 /TAXON_ID=89957 /ORGANISM="Polarella glacialis, Strain CCMP 1383" /LENGTH=316 /DNA_ID=CAMNT_0002576905 /DNA_START=22 /DNA_END=972 /DNA_ORIENTATION=+